MKIKGIHKAIFPTGKNAGRICAFVELGGRAEKDFNSFYEDIESLGVKFIVFSGRIDKNDECRVFIQNLGDANKEVLFVTTADDDIEALRSQKNISFMLTVDEPNEKEWKVNHKNFPLLLKTDEVVFKLTNENSLKVFEDFVAEKNLSQPFIVFSVSEELSAACLETKLTNSRIFIK